MAQNDVFKRYLDAGMAFTQMTRSKAEDIVRDWVKAGEVQRDQIQSQVDDLIERSRRSTDQLVALIREEVVNQCAQLGLVSKEDLRSLQRRLMEQFGAPFGSRSGGDQTEAAPQGDEPTASTGPVGQTAAPAPSPVVTPVDDTGTVTPTTTATAAEAAPAKRARKAAPTRKAAAELPPAAGGPTPAAGGPTPAGAPPGDLPPAKRARKAAPAAATKKAGTVKKAAPAKSASPKRAPSVRPAAPRPDTTTER